MSDITRAEVEGIGANALRVVVRVLKKHGQLVRHLKGEEVAKLTTADAADVVCAAAQAGNIKAPDLRKLAGWAVKRCGVGKAPALPEGEREAAETDSKTAREVAEAESDNGRDEEKAQPERLTQAPAPGTPQEAAELMRRAFELLKPTQSLDEDEIKRIAWEVTQEALNAFVREQAKPRPIVVEVRLPDGTTHKSEGIDHKSQATLLQFCAARVHTWLVGPAGTGKSTAALRVAKALGLEFGAVSVCGQTTEARLLGYMDATGTYRPTIFRKIYEGGGVFLLDEVDAGSANVLAVLNAALANGVCAFPDGMIAKHADFVCIAAGNTYGTGKTIEYIGRNAIDAATTDRFAFLFWDIDESLEMHVCGNKGWVSFVQDFRKKVAAKGIKTLVTPRASYLGAALLAQGVAPEVVVKAVLVKSMDAAQADAIVREIGSERLRNTKAA